MKNAISFFSVIFFMGCQGTAYEEELVADYSLRAIDVKSGMSVYYMDEEYLIGIVQSTVFAVGHNDEFIIAKQHPEDFPEIDKSITNYFIIPLKDKVGRSAEKNVIGPMSKENFERKRVELNIPESLTFTRVFKDLE